VNPKSSKKHAALSREFLKGLWAKIGTDNWFSVACEFKPDGKWKKSGDTIRGLCLEHQESNPSMDVQIDKGFVHCHGCGYREWNPLDFYRKLSGYSTVNVVGDIALRFQIKFPSKISEKIQAIKDHNDMKMAIFRACSMEFREQLIKTEPYAEKSINWLQSRNLDFSTSQMWPIGIVPPAGKMLNLLAHNKVGHLLPMINAYLYPEKAFHSIGHVALFPFSSPTTVGHIKIREPFSKTFRILPDEFSERMEGLFGLNTFVHLLGNLQDTPVYTVEGEFDALSLYSHSQACGHDLCVVATGGNFETSLGWLADFGIKNLQLLPDNDGGGIAWAQSILRKSPNASRVLNWPKTIDERVDPEEAVGKFGFAPFWEIVQNNLLSKSDWAYDVLSYQIIDVDDVTRLDRVSNVSKCLFDSDRSAFLQRVQKEQGVDTSLIPGLQATFEDDSIESFVIKVARDMGERYLPLYFEDNGPSRQFVMYSLPTKEILTFPIGKGNDRGRTELQRDRGFTLDDYFRKLGEPISVGFKVNKDGIPIPKTYETVTKLRNLCFQQSIETVNLCATPRARVEELKRGVHCVDNNIYVSNGRSLIKGENIDNEMIFSEMETPKLDTGKRHVLFSPGTKRWSEFINTPDDLYEGKGYDLKEIFETVVDLLDSWILEGKENGISQQFLAADLLYTTVASAFPTMTMLRLKGPSHSGKSALMSFLYRNRDPSGYYLCEAAEYVDSYSWAGIRGLMQGSKLRLCMDEFEQSNRAGSNRQGEAVNNILSNVRNTGQGSISTMGTANMGFSEFALNFPIFVAGIHSMNEYRDLSRFVPIETIRIDTLQSPLSKIRSKMTPEQIRELRKRVTLCMFTRIPEIASTYKTISHELSKFGLLERLVTAVTPAACVMKLAGIPDYMETVEKFIRLKAAQICNTVDDDDAAPLIKSILRTPFPSYMVSPNLAKSVVHLEELFKDPTAYDLSSLGVYLLDSKYLMIRWIELTATVLSNAKNFRYHSPQRLRSTLANSRYDIAKVSLPQTIQTKINDLIGTSANEYDYSIIDLQSLGVSIQNYHHSMVAQVAPPTQNECLSKFGDI